MSNTANASLKRDKSSQKSKKSQELQKAQKIQEFQEFQKIQKTQESQGLQEGIRPAKASLFFSKKDPQDPRLGDLAQRVSSDSTLSSPSARSVSFDLLGYPDDEGIGLNGGRKGAREAPDAIRSLLYGMTPASESHLSALHLRDLGNVPTSSMDLADRHKKGWEMAYQSLQSQKYFMGLGGGHDYAYADGGAFLDHVLFQDKVAHKVAQKDKGNRDSQRAKGDQAHVHVGTRDHAGTRSHVGTRGHAGTRSHKGRGGKEDRGGKKPLIINFDAHLDVRDCSRGLSSGTPFFRLLRDFPKGSFYFLEVGIQSQCTSPFHAKWLKEQGGWIWTLEDIYGPRDKKNLQGSRQLKNSQGSQQGSQRGNPQENQLGSLYYRLLPFLEEKNLLGSPTFVSLDMDAFASHSSPGCSQSWPQGLEVKDFLFTFRELIHRLEVSMFSVYELSPPLDPLAQSTKLAALCCYQFMEDTLNKVLQKPSS